jgi:hypothetical protein
VNNLFQLSVMGLLALTAPVWAAEYDVVVYGGTAGGTIAAIAAANEGADVALIEPGRHIGGMVSGGLGRTDHAKKAVIGGMSREFYERLGDHYGEEITWYPEPHVAEKTLRAWIDETSVEVLFERRVDTVEMQGKHIASITMLNGDRFEADIFIDASYEGDLLPRANITYTWGREGQDVYGESLAGRRLFSPKHQFLAPVSPYDSNGELSPLVYTGDDGEVGQGDRKVQAYNFRLCMTKDKDNQVPWPKPDGYDPARWELLGRYLKAVPGLTVDKLMHPAQVIPNGKTDTNNNGAISTDYIGGSWDYPEADYERRAEIWEDHKRYVQGFCYFLAHDPSVPESIRDEMNEWGLAKDEFVDTDNWPHQLYIREARRMIGEYVMHQADLQTDRTKPDSIGMGSYNSDSHNVQRITNTAGSGWPEDVEAVINEGDMQVGVRPYEIAYRAITPKKAECENLIVPVCFSASHVAYSSMRMEPQYMIIGQAAGVAGVMALKNDVAVQDINVDALRARLREQKAVLAMRDAEPADIDPAKLEGIVVDNDKAIEIGKWRGSTSVRPYVGYDYATEVEPGTNRNRIQFVPNLPKAGKYTVRVAYTPHPNRATNAQVIVQTTDGPVEVELNQRKPLGDGAPFKTIGTYTFDAGKQGMVEIVSVNADGYVIADAVQWIPVDK